MDRIALTGSDLDNWLQIDFRGSTLSLPGSRLSKCCPLDGDNIEEDLACLEERLDAVVINLPLAWLEYEDLLPLLRSRLRPGGQLFFVTFGPDTLIELRQAWAETDSLPHVHDFIDMHHIGDVLLKSGYSKPIVDADWVGVEYQDIDMLLEDLRHEGFHNILSNRRKMLTGKRRIEDFRRAFSSARDLARVTFEIIYGYGEIAPHRQNSVQVGVPTTK